MSQNETHSHNGDITLTTTPQQNHQQQEQHPILTLHLKDPILGTISDTLLAITTMASTNSTSTDPIPSSSDDVAVKAVNKRYEGLVTVRTKAIKGKGAWYWAHLEPILVRNPETGLPKSVKLKCTLCDSMFSASNPSRTASEHLKRGTCPNFSTGLRPTGSVPSPHPISMVAGSNRKRGSPGSASPTSPTTTTTITPYHQNHTLAMVESSRFCSVGGEIGYTQVHNNSVHQHQNQQNLVLSGDTSGKYLPPFKCLTREQEKDVDKLLTRLASREEAHIVLMELMKWRTEGLDPLYAQAVQMKQRDPVTAEVYGDASLL
ncbi:hypothetical protein TanjilG_19978 [Lupinus angustifolius]|uniref:DUF7963 domain-containing protein n=1 Tax=Lupinus angustifolius TaxID=3871 RepID=A0A4P1RC66_LUPAN|nr:hypothetical protein TanjilG_19978 [Lupinus angustifolius]